jgi:hypothetical protein
MALPTHTRLESILGPRGLPLLGVMPEVVSDMLGLQRFCLRLVPNQTIALKPEATLRSKYGMKMRVESI